MNVFFFHSGYQPYLELTIRQASLQNKVFLIGDSSNMFLGNIKNVTHVLLNDYKEDVDRFLSSYHHLHTGGQAFEEWCFIRWIAVRNVAKEFNLDTIFYSDSDNLIYSNLDDVYRDIERPSFALSVPKYQPPYRHSATGEVSFWKYEVLDEFCSFMLKMYEDPFEFGRLLEKWNWHKTNNLAGGICDMTVLWHFTNIKKHTILTDVLNNNTTFDHSINNSTNYEDNEYLMENGLKKIDFIDDIPYGYNLLLNKKIRFHNLQFQGNTKHLIKKYVRNNTYR